jgi:signal peptidase I
LAPESNSLSTTASVLSAFKEVLQIILPALFLAALIHLFLAQATIVRGQSMQPNLRPEERLIMEKLSYYFREPRHNEIVVLDMPESKALIIKRVVGLPGETVEIKQGHVYVDGRIVPPPLDITPRSQVLVDGDEVKAPPRYGDAPSVYGPIKLETDSYFVLGDNRDNSNDSRAFGPVDRDFIKGRVWVRYWPLTRLFIFR